MRQAVHEEAANYWIYAIGGMYVYFTLTLDVITVKG